jgi:hypothetical protein
LNIDIVEDDGIVHVELNIDEENAENENDVENTGVTDQGSNSTDSGIAESEVPPPPPSTPYPRRIPHYPYPPFYVVKLNEAIRVSIPYPPGLLRDHPAYPDGFLDFHPDDIIVHDIVNTPPVEQDPVEQNPIGLQMFNIFTPDASDASRPPSPTASLWDFDSEESC